MEDVNKIETNDPVKIVVVCRSEDVMSGFGRMNERVARTMVAIREFMDTCASQSEENPNEREVIQAIHRVIEKIIEVYPISMSQMDADIASLQNLRISNKTFSDMASEEARLA